MFTPHQLNTLSLSQLIELLQHILHELQNRLTPQDPPIFDHPSPAPIVHVSHSVVSVSCICHCEWCSAQCVRTGHHTVHRCRADLDTVGNSAGSGMDGGVWQQIDFQFDDVSDGTDLFRHGFADIDFEDDGTKLLSSVDCLQVLDLDGYNLALERA